MPLLLIPNGNINSRILLAELDFRDICRNAIWLFNIAFNSKQKHPKGQLSVPLRMPADHFKL